MSEILFKNSEQLLRNGKKTLGNSFAAHCIGAATYLPSSKIMRNGGVMQ